MKLFKLREDSNPATRTRDSNSPASRLEPRPYCHAREAMLRDGARQRGPEVGRALTWKRHKENHPCGWFSLCRTPSETRTHTGTILSRLPLPIGLWGQRLKSTSSWRAPDALRIPRTTHAGTQSSEAQQCRVRARSCSTSPRPRGTYARRSA